MAGYSVVIPARDAAPTLGRVLDALAAQQPAPLEAAGALRRRGDLRLGARNLGWEEARGDGGVPSATSAASSAGSLTGWPGRSPSSRARTAYAPARAATLLRAAALPVRLAPARFNLAEWTLGARAVRYAAHPPALRGGPQPRFE